MSKLSKNIAYNITGQALLLILSFVASKYIFGQLGEEALGLIFFTIMINSLLSTVLNTGVSVTSMREISSHYQDEPVYIHQLIRTFSLFYWGIYVLLGLCLYVMAPVLVEGWINIVSMDESTAIHALRILGITSFIILPKSFYDSLFRGLERMEFNNIISVATIGIRYIGIIFILGFEGSFFHVVYWFAACYVLEVLTYQILLAQFFSASAFIPGYFHSVIKRNAGFTSNMTLITLFLSIHQKIDKAIISKMMPIGALGYYGLAERIVTSGELLSSSVMSAAYPSFSALYNKGSHNKLMSQYKKLQDVLCFGNVPILAFISYMSLPILSYVLNEEVGRTLHLPVILLCLGTYLNATMRMPITASHAMGKPEIDRNANFYFLLMALPLSVVFIYYFGLIGASMVLISRVIFFYLYSMPRICSECLNCSVLEWYLHIFKIIILSSLTYGVTWLVMTLLNDFSIFMLCFAYISATVVFLIISYSIIDKDLKDILLLNFVSTKRKLLKAI